MDAVGPMNDRVQEMEISHANEKPSSDVCDLDSEDRLPKKPKVNNGEDLRRVAEIIMVLSAMGKIRAGRNPSAAEKGLMVEAREKLAEMCESLPPKDLLSTDAVRIVMEDLGLHKIKEPWEMEIRPPKLSISQRFSLSKGKMEKALKFASQASYTSRMHTMTLGANTDGQVTRNHPGGSHWFPLDKPNAAPLSAGNFQTTSPMAPVSAFNPPAVSSEVQAQPAIILMNPPSSNSAANDSHSFVLPQTEPAHFILEQPYNGPSYLFQVRANTAGDNLQENTPTSSSQMPSVALPQVDVLNKVADHTPTESERSHEPNTFQVASQAVRDPNSKAFAVQTAPFQGLTFVQQPSSFYTPHIDIARNVQKILQPKVPDQPQWTPPSIDYMNKPMTCELCKLIITDVESLLICDACEKGVHIKCLQSFNQKVIPKGEWHCLKCVEIGNGRPLPPKYGRVSRNVSTTKASMASSGVQALLEKKVENTDQKIFTHQKLLANGNPALLNSAQSGSAGNIPGEPTVDIKASNRTELQVVTSNILSVEDGVCTRTCDDPSKEGAEEICPPGVLEENDNQTALINELTSFDTKMSIVPHNRTSKVETRSLSDCLVGIVQGVSFHAESISSPHDNSKQQVQIDDEVSENQIPEASKSVPHNRTSKFETRSLSDCLVGIVQGASFHAESLSSPHDNSKQQVQIDDEVSENHIPEASKSMSELHTPASPQNATVSSSEVEQRGEGNHVSEGGNVDGSADNRCSMQNLPDVEWVGDIIRVFDEKTYHVSCSINGMVFKLQDYVLFASNHHDLLPSKLQGLWEDDKTKLKWALLNKCYFPDELPEIVGRPCTPETNEVYESNHGNVVAARLIQGPCQVLPPIKFEEESERRKGEPNNGLNPVFLSKWFYDEAKGLFRPVTD